MFNPREMVDQGSVILVGTLNAITFVYDVITYPIYALIQQPWKQRGLSRRVKASKIHNEKSSITFRSVDSPGSVHIELLRNNLDTMDKMFRYCAKKYEKRRCLGTRRIIRDEDEVQPNGRIFKKFVMEDFYEWRTFRDVDMEATYFGRGIRSLGQKPKQNIVIFAETRAEWMIVAHGLFRQNIPVVTIYATLGEDAIAHGINETEVTMVITTQDLLPKFKKILPMTPKVESIIYMGDSVNQKDIDLIEATKKGVSLISFKKVQDLGVSSSERDEAPNPSDIAIIMYTSGSTGVPKGVIITHENLVTTMKGFCDAVDVCSEDVLLGFLPLAHVFELLAENVCLLTGMSIGYSSPLTLIDSSSGLKSGVRGDAAILRPTALTTVPLILDRISKGVQEKVSKSNIVSKSVFSFAYNYKKRWMKRGYDTPILNKLLFSKITGLLGGRVKMLLCGGAPLSPETHEFIKICLCTKVIQGYGLTETTSCATVMDRNDRTLGRAGAPATICDIRLIDWEEGKYRVTDKPYPRGEIVIGGANISPGYYKLSAKTMEDFFDEDGKRWFKTGDIAEIHNDGVLKIIDRKKDLVKLQAGEYVSLGKVEAELKTCPIVENICVYGDPTKQNTVALVVPNFKNLSILATKNGITDTEIEELCSNKLVEKLVLSELTEHGRKCKLQKFEIPTAIKLCKDVWTPDMGLVTAAFKLKRKDIQERYQHEINRMYAS